MHENFEIKKIIIFFIVFLLLAGFFVFFNLYKEDRSINTTTKDIPTYINIDNIDFLTNKNQNELKNKIEKYVYKELEYTENEVDEINFLEKTYTDNNKKYFFFILNDGLDTMYGTYYNTKTNTLSTDFIWYGDANNSDYIDSSIPYSYLEIVNEKKFNDDAYQKKVEDTLPDNNDDGIYDY
ncbi:hypothetical protein B5E92_11580 [Erysipelatoclostridium sp. An15]|uniref:hypothetical protein n=1 Tax=Erysipelatoclostridium sp. An15 TaxID=1965566 RepID=UPI000B37956D|nr:hypothetical protein [Erysipelatoclostridium sp. An15]OUQ06073.1 hypothetical protein B5E92_11580 [Erysipelatoclostridium sp. An15]